MLVNSDDKALSLSFKSETIYGRKIFQVLYDFYPGLNSFRAHGVGLVLETDSSHGLQHWAFELERCKLRLDLDHSRLDDRIAIFGNIKVNSHLACLVL